MAKFNILIDKKVVILAVRSLSVLMSFLLNIYITNTFSEELSGEILYSINSFLFLGTIASLGLNNSIVVKLSSSNTVNSFSAEVFLKYFALGLAVLLPVVIAFIQVSRGGGASEMSMFVFALGGGVHLFQIHLVALLISIDQQIKSILYETIIPIGLFFLSLGFLMKEKDIHAMQWYYLLSFMVPYLFVGVMITIKGAKYKSEKRDKLVLNDVYSFGGLMIVTVLVSYFPIQIGGLYLSMAEIAALIVMLKVSSLIRVAYTVVINLYLKEIAAAFAKNDMVKFRDSIYYASKILCCLSLFFFLMVSLLGEWVLSLFGSYYESFYYLLVIISGGQCIFVTFGAVGYGLILSGKSNLLRNYMAVTVLVLGLIGIVMTSHYGIVALSITISVLIASQHVVAGFLLYKIYGINVFRRGV